jgi:hypothetical protein
MAQATLDDQFDSDAQLCRGFENMEVDIEDLEPEELQEMRAQALAAMGESGRGRHTGY